jgi:pyruvate kinase
MAQQAGAKAIITMTHSGYTGFKLAAYRPNANICVFTDNKSILEMLNLVWGVRGFYYDKNISTDHTIADIKHYIKLQNIVRQGDFVINIISMPINEKGKTNTMKLSVIE